MSRLHYEPVYPKMLAVEIKYRRRILWCDVLAFACFAALAILTPGWWWWAFAVGDGIQAIMSHRKLNELRAEERALLPEARTV